MSQVLRSVRHPSASRPFLAKHDSASDDDVVTGLRFGIPLGVLLWAILIGLGYLAWLIL